MNLDVLEGYVIRLDLIQISYYGRPPLTPPWGMRGCLFMTAWCDVGLYGRQIEWDPCICWVGMRVQAPHWATRDTTWLEQEGHLINTSHVVSPRLQGVASLLLSGSGSPESTPGFFQGDLSGVGRAASLLERSPGPPYHLRGWGRDTQSPSTRTKIWLPLCLLWHHPGRRFGVLRYSVAMAIV